MFLNFRYKTYRVGNFSLFFLAIGHEVPDNGLGPSGPAFGKGDHPNVIGSDLHVVYFWGQFPVALWDYEAKFPDGVVPSCPSGLGEESLQILVSFAADLDQVVGKSLRHFCLIGSSLSRDSFI